MEKAVGEKKLATAFVQLVSGTEKQYLKLQLHKERREKNRKVAEGQLKQKLVLNFFKSFLKFVSRVISAVLIRKPSFSKILHTPVRIEWNF